MPLQPEWQSHISWHVYTYIVITYGHLKPTKICPISRLIIGQYRIPQNSAKTYKFRGNGQIPSLSSKFHEPRKTVVPNPDCPVTRVL